MTADGKTVTLTPARAARAAASAARVGRPNSAPRRGAVAAALAGDRERGAVLAAALSGRAPAALTCRLKPESYPDQQLGPDGLVPRAARVRTSLEHAFGDLPLGGFAPGGVTQGHMPGSAHYDGRAIDVFFRPVTPASQRAGWAVAHWLVAHANQLAITVVIYDDRIWSVQHAAQGWRDYHPPGGPTRDPTRLHRDHVHVAVAGGQHRESSTSPDRTSVEETKREAA